MHSVRLQKAMRDESEDFLASPQIYKFNFIPKVYLYLLKRGYSKAYDEQVEYGEFEYCEH